jgi:hypothetical protein
VSKYSLSTLPHQDSRPHLRVRTPDLDELRAAVKDIQILCEEIRRSGDSRVLLDGIRVISRRASELCESLPDSGPGD